MPLAIYLLNNINIYSQKIQEILYTYKASSYLALQGFTKKSLRKRLTNLRKRLTNLRKRLTNLYCKIVGIKSAINIDNYCILIFEKCKKGSFSPYIYFHRYGGRSCSNC